MDPLTIAIIAAAAVQTGVSIYGSIKGGNAQSDAAERQAKIDEQNQKLANEQADMALHDATARAGRIATEGSLAQGRAKLAAASGNVDVASGSVAEAQSQIAVLSEYQQSVARLEGSRMAYGYRSQGLQFGAAAAARRATGSDFATAGYLNAAGALAGGVAGAGAAYWRLGGRASSVLPGSGGDSGSGAEQGWR